ncbi:hypothetical protein ACIQMJ_28120 [Actinosynnema sp. NPDC091369]
MQPPLPVPVPLVAERASVRVVAVTEPVRVLVAVLEPLRLASVAEVRV